MVEEAVAESSIGIKIANGSYYKVLEEGSHTKKRVVLTTVNDNQSSVQIDLYKGHDHALADAKYIGSLVIDSIEPAPKGKPDIELVLGVDTDGTLNATAGDRATGERQSLSVSMASLDQGSTYDVPDFSLDERYQPDLGVSAEEASSLTSAGNVAPEAVREVNRPSALRVVAIIFFSVVLLAIIALLLYRFVLPSKGQGPAQTQAAPALPAKSLAAPTSEKAAPAAKPAVRYGGVYYYIRWGDTLWDLSMSFYRTPWLYGKIAKANSIKNPDLIFAHTQIYIPDR